MSNKTFLIDKAVYGKNGTVDITGKGIFGNSSEKIELTCDVTALCQATTTPKDQNDPKTVQANLFKLTDLATVMDKKGWKVAAHLQRQWFARAALEMPSTTKRKPKWGESDPKYDYANFDLINYQWLSQFSRTKNIVEYLKYNLLTERGKKRVIQTLIDNHKLKENSFQKGYVEDHSTASNIRNVADCKQLHKYWQTQYKGFDTDEISKVPHFFKAKAQAMDDLWAAFAGCSTYAALGDFSLVGQAGDYCLVTIESFYFYFIDTYEFIGDEQYLGHWNKNGVIVDASYINQNPFSTNENRVEGTDSRRHPVFLNKNEYFKASELYFCVRNAHFNQYRKKYGKGGDMIVWSKPHKIKLDIPKKYTTFAISKREFTNILAKT